MKRELVDKILKEIHGPYTMDSGLIIYLRIQLFEMTIQALGNLKTLIWLYSLDKKQEGAHDED